VLAFQKQFEEFFCFLYPSRKVAQPLLIYKAKYKKERGKTKMKKITICFVILAVLAILSEAMASSADPSFFCDQSNRLVRIGDSEADVVLKCGYPTWAEQRQEEFFMMVTDDMARLLPNPTDWWTYNFGPNRFMQTLKFRNGRLVAIQEGDFGY
jgi:hypothetical protein